MSEEAGCEPVRIPQDLERLLVSAERARYVDGMAALYEPNAVQDTGDGRLLSGRDAIRAFYADMVASGRKLISENNVWRLSMVTWRPHQLAFPVAPLTAAVARRQSDGTWLWVIDRFSIA